jgi:hypothetical protein
MPGHTYISVAATNHIFSGIVYYQCLRLRKIINSTERLKVELDIIKDAFMESGYPRRMVNNIAAKVLTMDRILELERKNIPTTAPDEPTPSVPIKVISSVKSMNPT